MCDAWLAGIGLKENASGQSMAGGNPGAALPAATLLGPMIGVLGAMADLAAANRRRFDQPSAGAATRSPPGGQHDPIAADFLLPMGQAMMIAAGSERLVAADELRALLREVGDLATREARILQNELSALDENLAQTFQQPDLSGSYRRRWRSKV